MVMFILLKYKTIQATHYYIKKLQKNIARFHLKIPVRMFLNVGEVVSFFLSLFCFFVFLRQGLAMLHRLAWNSRFSCLSFLSAGITGMGHHAWQKFFVFF
jgi:hypothetical protein